MLTQVGWLAKDLQVAPVIGASFTQSDDMVDVILIS